MAVSSCARVLHCSFVCRPDPHFTGNPRTEIPSFSTGKASSLPFHGGSSASSLFFSSGLILKFPPNFVRQLSTKARRNCSNIGVAQVVAASWSNNPSSAVPASATAVNPTITAPLDEISIVPGPQVVVDGDGSNSTTNNVQFKGLAALTASFLRSDGSLSVHAGERLGRVIVTDALTTPIVNTSAYFFKNTDQLIDFKEGHFDSFEYGRYGNPTTVVAEEKLSALEGAESTQLMASGMYASIVMMFALVPAGGHIITTTDCYRKTRIFIETMLPKMGIMVTVIDPADMESLESTLEKHDVTLFFTESPTNPYLRCVDIELVSKLCHSHGALVCVDGTFATPVNQKALALGADIVLHSATKYIGGHNDVLAGYVSGSEKIISEVRKIHHIFGGALNPNAAYLLIRGMKTLHLRVQQQNFTASRMAEILEAHPKVARVHYPGLSSHPEHHIAKQQMTGFGGVVSFEVDGDLMTAKKFIDNLKIPYNAPSFGGCESIVDQPAIMSYWDLKESGRAKVGIKESLIRFSFGIEDFEDLKADILHALEAI
ncbi:cystathionine gamma-synthase 1, chloroplastic-like [Macadamia integrifolia]|uniref:cystathionine gamma-synthase 1, chloroplastic-like n=1 Tax=Macadamia integrifolia TaxID=60698 RepID=UPI001C4E6EAC|nr:cystathionine gamma-synthase 1, chloroplastic-like [Macadamia integrifolia]